MNNTFPPTGRIQFVFRRSSKSIKKVAVAAVALSLLALVSVHVALAQTREQAEDLRAQAAALEQENQDLQQYIGELGSVQSIERIAREELDLADPDTVIIDPQG